MGYTMLRPDLPCALNDTPILSQIRQRIVTAQSYGPDSSTSTQKPRNILNGCLRVSAFEDAHVLST